jgi:hypothetical protein
MLSTLPSAFHRFVLAIFAFLTILVIGYGSDLVLLRHPHWMVSDDLLLGTLAAIVVYHYEKQRSVLLGEKLRVIREMNAFIRNELQVLYASADLPDKMRFVTIQRSVEHIEWALRELLPGTHSLADAPSDGSNTPNNPDARIA